MRWIHVGSALAREGVLAASTLRARARFPQQPRRSRTGDAGNGRHDPLPDPL